MSEDNLTMTQAAKINRVTRQAVYIAIKKKRLKAQKKNGRWIVAKQDLDEYKQYKYSRTKSTYNGKLVFDNQAGFFSLNQVAEMLNLPVQHLYYNTRVGRLKYQRKGSAYVVHMSEVVEFKEKYLDIHIKSA